MSDDLLDKHPVLRSKFLKDVKLTATSGVVEINHGLGKVFLGAVVVGVSESIVVTPLTPSRSTDASKRIALHKDTNVAATVTLLVYW